MRARIQLGKILFTGLVSAVASAALFAACGGGDEGATGTSNGTAAGGDLQIESLAIDPTAAELVIDGPTPKTQQFTAIGTLADGTTKPVPAAFSVDAPAPGSIDAASGLYTTSNQAGGLVHVAAAYNGKTATADLKVLLKPQVSEGTVPDGAPDQFDPTKNTPITDEALSPQFVYPAPGTMFPTNVYKTLFQWRAKGYSLFHLRFEGEFLDFSVYTDGAHPTCVGAQSGAGCWESTIATWQWLAGSAAGKSVKVTVEAADPAQPGTYFVGKSIEIFFSKTPVPGAIYYWSTTQAGVMRATVSDAAPSPFLTPNETGQCVACHTLSRNGKRMGADVGGESLWVVGVGDSVPPPVVFDSYNNKEIPNAWSTFNPDATRVISARSGILKLLDGDTGAPVGPNNGIIPLSPLFGTQPDWAPDGKHIAFAHGPANKDRGIQGSSLAMMSNAGGDAFDGLVTVRKSAANSDTYAYPMFDPTSQWIVYMHATGASDKNDAAQLYIAPAQANAEEWALANANTIVGDAVIPVGIANNMPTWAPTPAPEEIRWIAFASKRDYGLVLAPTSKYGDEKQQLWVAAIDPQKLGSGDPSFPAFRLPFQLLTENNHRPFWAEDAFKSDCDGGPCELPDAGGEDVACKNIGEDCSSGACCPSLYCAPDAQGTTYVCTTIK